MQKSLFEQVCGTYTQIGDYLLPNLLITQEQKEIGNGSSAIAGI